MWMRLERSASRDRLCSKAGRSKKPVRRIRAAVVATVADAAATGVVVVVTAVDAAAEIVAAAVAVATEDRNLQIKHPKSL